MTHLLAMSDVQAEGNAPGIGAYRRNHTAPDTEARVNRMMELRGLGLTWDDVGLSFGISKAAAQDLCVRHGRVQRRDPQSVEAVAWREKVAASREFEAEKRLDYRQALPAGHEASWGWLLVGTVLHGVPYPE